MGLGFCSVQVAVWLMRIEFSAWVVGQAVLWSLVFELLVGGSELVEWVLWSY